MDARTKRVDLEVIGEQPEDKDDFYAYAKAFFKRRAGVDLTDEDVREILFNLKELFDLLYELEEQEAQMESSTNERCLDE